MKAIVVMFDTLRKGNLSPYGSKGTITPNFKRLAEKTVRFDQFFAGGLPCMPSRREMHTGRYHFMHRSWGPVEPFDDSMPELLKKNGIYTHLVTDHKHYWRDGGATYHTRYSSFELIRGQEGDAWKGKVDKELVRSGVENIGSKEGQMRKILSKSQDKVNRSYMTLEKEHHCARTMNAGLEFLQDNAASDNWFLQIECFDPHEPFFVPKRFLEMYGIEEEFDGWVNYTYDYSKEKSELIQKYYKALVTMCDEYLGRVLDFMDAHNLWKDTMLIVNTDHGFLLGEHEWWGKNIMPVYNEIANIPFFIWDPVCGIKDESRSALAQTIDIPATLLDFFAVPIPKDMQGKPLRKSVLNNESTRENALFGYFGSNINITDGCFTYMRSPKKRENEELYEYTLMPTRINRRFTPLELKDMQLHPPFSFTKDCQILKIKSEDLYAPNYQRFGNKLFDCILDPNQKQSISDAGKEFEMIEKMKLLMEEGDAPEELYQYYGLDDICMPGDVQKELDKQNQFIQKFCDDISFKNNSVMEGYLYAVEWLKEDKKNTFIKKLKTASQEGIVGEDVLLHCASECEEKKAELLLYGMKMAMRME